MCSLFGSGGFGWSASKKSIKTGAQLYELSGRDWKLVLKATEPHPDGTLKTFKEVVDFIVETRIKEHK